jgi:hypothetical protein
MLQMAYPSRLRSRHPSKGASMNITEIIITIGLFAGAIWWAWTANWDACNSCDYDCDQGRNCPARKKET